MWFSGYGIVVLIREDAITLEDLAGFSEELQAQVQFFIERQPNVDLFPHTYPLDLFPCTVDIQAIVSFHVECVVLMSRADK